MRANSSKLVPNTFGRKKRKEKNGFFVVVVVCYFLATEEQKQEQLFSYSGWDKRPNGLDKLTTTRCGISKPGNRICKTRRCFTIMHSHRLIFITIYPRNAGFWQTVLMHSSNNGRLSCCNLPSQAKILYPSSPFAKHKTNVN